MSEENQINEERLKKFQNMGIPVPVTPIDPSAVKNLNADPDKLKKLEAIRSGANKNLFQSIAEKAVPAGAGAATFVSIPTPKKKQNPNAPKSEVVVPIKSFSPDTKADKEAMMFESALFG